MFFQQNLRLPNEEIQKQQKENTLEKDHPFLEHKKKKIIDLHFGSSWSWELLREVHWGETWGELGELVEVSGMDSLHTHADALYSGKLTWEGGKSWKLRVFRTENQWGVDPAHQKSCHGWERHVKQRFHKNHECPVSVREMLFLFLVGVKTPSYLLDSFYIASLLHWFRALRPLSRWTRHRWEWNYSYVYNIYIYIQICVYIYIWKTKKHGVDLNMNLAPTHKRLGEAKLTSRALIESQQDFLFAKQKESYVTDFVLFDGINCVFDHWLMESSTNFREYLSLLHWQL